MRALLVLVPLLAGCVAADDDLGGELENVPDASFDDGKADGVRRHYVSASSVEALNEDLSSLMPRCQTADAFHDCDDYLASSSALGNFGPLGAFGPLGTSGPLGSNAWNASHWMSAVGDWSKWSDTVDGPLSEQGPLGPAGPLSDEAYFETLPAINDWARQLQSGGVWTVLGPLGPLGPIGPLGPLGPLAWI